VLGAEGRGKEKAEEEGFHGGDGVRAGQAQKGVAAVWGRVAKAVNRTCCARFDQPWQPLC
jgi:hypothetical protein